MGIGFLNKVVVFKKNTPTTLGAGSKDAYTTLLTTRGTIRKQNGSRGISFGEILESSSYELIVRVQILLESNLSTSIKVEMDGRLFTVSSWEKIEEKRFYYKIQLNEQRS